MTRLRLSPAEHDLVTSAVTQAEIATDGEIVTIVTERSDAYHDVALHYALAAMLLAAGVAAIWPGWLTAAAAVVDRGWTSEPGLGALLFALMIVEAGVFLLVRLAFAWMPLRLALTPGGTKSRRVRRRAVQYFKVGAERRTQARVGILLFLSLDEHAAEIVADEAIHGKVTPETWAMRWPRWSMKCAKAARQRAWPRR